MAKDITIALLRASENRALDFYTMKLIDLTTGSTCKTCYWPGNTISVIPTYELDVVLLIIANANPGEKEYPYWITSGYYPGSSAGIYGAGTWGTYIPTVVYDAIWYNFVTGETIKHLKEIGYYSIPEPSTYSGHFSLLPGGGIVLPNYDYKLISTGCYPMIYPGYPGQWTGSTNNPIPTDQTAKIGISTATAHSSRDSTKLHLAEYVQSLTQWPIDGHIISTTSGTGMGGEFYSITNILGQTISWATSRGYCDHLGKIHPCNYHYTGSYYGEATQYGYAFCISKYIANYDNETYDATTGVGYSWASGYTYSPTAYFNEPARAGIFETAVGKLLAKHHFYRLTEVPALNLTSANGTALMHYGILYTSEGEPYYYKQFTASEKLLKSPEGNIMRYWIDDNGYYYFTRPTNLIDSVGGILPLYIEQNTIYSGQGTKVFTRYYYNGEYAFGLMDWATGDWSWQLPMPSTMQFVAYDELNKLIYVRGSIEEAGVGCVLHCLDSTSGERLWSTTYFACQIDMQASSQYTTLYESKNSLILPREYK